MGKLMDILWKQSGRELSKEVFSIISQTWTEDHRLPEECTPLAPTVGSSTVKKENSKIQSYLNSFFSRNEWPGIHVRFFFLTNT
jgi:uncharacterized protein YdaU (DUF1376 family)